MTKEEIFELLKSQMLALRDKSSELQADKRLMMDWSAKTSALIQAIKEVNSCDMNWLNDEYGKWFDKEIKPFIKKLNGSLLKRINS